MTERRLENIATFYLQRFSATAAHLRTVLIRRIDKSLDPKADDRSTRRTEMIGWVEKLLTRLIASGAVNDATYAHGLTRKLRRLGKSPAVIQARLRAKGVAPMIIDDVLEDTRQTVNGTDAALEAALAYARRRKLGPFRTTAVDPASHKRDLGVLARAGFSLDIARKVLTHTPEDE